MSREIKFRAWDSKNNHMFYHDDEGNFGMRIECDRVGSDFNVNDLLFSPFECLKLMQFTGLKDKNGVDIYEGDIVKWINGSHYWEAVISTVKNNKTNTLYAVETFNNLSTNEDDTEYTFIREDSRKGFRNELEYLSKTAEIIGNIHENPELLNND